MAFAADFYEIDFLAVETAKSGDAITVRAAVNGVEQITVVDGGFTDMGKKIVAHIVEHYGNRPIDHVVLTHSDQDHALGLKHILETCNVSRLWMNRPWIYADELISRFKTYNSVNALRTRLRSEYGSVASLEDIAIERNIPISEALQGAQIGYFTVLAPSRMRYLDLIVESKKTPLEADKSEASLFLEALTKSMATAAKTVVNFVLSGWGEEIFSPGGVSAENEMSVIQFANLHGEKILLTGDAGRGALEEAINYAPLAGCYLPGIDRFQVPHHGSRRNVNTDILDRILGPRVEKNMTTGSRFSAYVSSAKADLDHPRKSVIRAMIHRDGKVICTEGVGKRFGRHTATREGWSPVTPESYPESQET